MSTPMVWAHRGASHYAPENTLEAFLLAADMGADGIELDVHLSGDGELIVAHDETVDRCSSGTGDILSMTLSQLKELDFSNRKPGYRGVRVPTLEEVYRAVKPTGMVINVELKTNANAYDGIEQKCVDLARAAGMADRIYYSSFNHYSLLRVRGAEPGARIAPLYSEIMADPWIYAAHIGAQAVHPHYLSLTARGLMDGLKSAGVLCNPWTVDADAQFAWMKRLEVNAVITNRPDAAKKAFA